MTDTPQLQIPIFADVRKLTPEILRDCGVLIGNDYPIISNWLSVAAERLAQLEAAQDHEAMEYLLDTSKSSDKLFSNDVCEIVLDWNNTWNDYAGGVPREWILRIRKRRSIKTCESCGHSTYPIEESQYSGDTPAAAILAAKEQDK